MSIKVSFNRLPYTITPERREELRIARIKRIKNLTPEFQLGLYVGEHITNRFLPTLSTHMLQSRKVIKVSDEDTTKHNELENNWFKIHEDKNADEDTKKNVWDIHLAHMKELEKKYLPHELVCYLPALNITNMAEFKKGIKIALWDSDMCSYKVNENEFEVTNDDDGYFTKINFNLDIN